MITVLHRGGYAQMITILHGGGGSLGTPKSDYVICARPHIRFYDFLAGSIGHDQNLTIGQGDMILGQVCLVRLLQFQFYRIFKKGNVSIWVTTIYRFTIKVNNRSLRQFIKKGGGPKDEKVIPNIIYYNETSLQ